MIQQWFFLTKAKPSKSSAFLDFGVILYCFLMDFAFFCLPTSFGPFSIATWSQALRFKQETNEIGIFCFPGNFLIEQKMIEQILIDKNLVDKNVGQKNWQKHFLSKKIGRTKNRSTKKFSTIFFHFRRFIEYLQKNHKMRFRKNKIA